MKTLKLVLASLVIGTVLVLAVALFTRQYSDEYKVRPVGDGASLTALEINESRGWPLTFYTKKTCTGNCSDNINLSNQMIEVTSFNALNLVADILIFTSAAMALMLYMKHRK